MKRDYGPMPKTREEAILVALSARDEDIDLTEMPEAGGVTKWRHGNARAACPQKTKEPARRYIVFSFGQYFDTWTHTFYDSRGITYP